MKNYPGSNPLCLHRQQPVLLCARGFTMLELIVTMAVLAILTALVAPSFSSFMVNSQIKAGAESIENGLRFARAEAVRRNTQVRFQLTTDLAATCALSNASGNWVISIDNPAGACGAVTVKDAFALSDTANNPAPRILQRAPAAEGSRSATVAADQSTVVFNGIGKLTPTPAAAININLSNPQAGNCVAQGGVVRCLRVVVTGGGQVRMCDPSYASPDPRGC